MNSIKPRKSLYKAIAIVLATLLWGWMVGDWPLFFSIFFLVALQGWFYTLLFWIFLPLWYLLTKQPIKPLKEPFLASLFMVSLSLVLMACGLTKADWRSRQAETFVVSAARQLDTQNRKGQPYPQQLPPALERQKPSIVQYESDGKKYSFTYDPPLAWDEFYLYESDTHSWRFITD